MSELDELVDEILAEGLDDWVMLISIVRSAESRRSLDQEAARKLAMDLVAELVEGGWMVPGDLEGTGFRPWELAPADAVARIAREWDEADGDAMHHVIAWFDNTEKGNSRAEIEDAES